MQQLNIYEAPAVLIEELEEKDIITTSIGDGEVGEIGGDGWDW